MNCILLHGMSSYLEDGFGHGVIERAKKLGLNIIIPHFPLKEKITIENWEETALQYKKYFANSIIICHSLSTMFILKFLHKYQLTCLGLITVAGGYIKKVVVPSFLYLKTFIPTLEDFAYAKRFISDRYSFYSSEDKIFTQKQLKDYMNLLDSKAIFLENCGHFGLQSGVKDIPEIEKILVDIINKNSHT